MKYILGLPEGAEAKQLTNALSSDGILTIKIPVRDYRPPISPSIQATTLASPALATSPNDSVSVSDQQFRLTFDLSGYKPDDVTVKVNNNVLKGKSRFKSIERDIYDRILLNFS